VPALRCTTSRTGELTPCIAPTTTRSLIPFVELRDVGRRIGWMAKLPRFRLVHLCRGAFRREIDRAHRRDSVLALVYKPPRKGKNIVGRPKVTLIHCVVAQGCNVHEFLFAGVGNSIEHDITTIRRPTNNVTCSQQTREPRGAAVERAGSASSFTSGF
jgi:hypothetical protein